MKKLFIIAGAVALAFTHTPVKAAEHIHPNNTKNDDPAGLMSVHSHETGNWMLSYQGSFMKMDGYRDGNDRVSTSTVLGSFAIAPQEMTMQMHMLGVMYGVNDKVTVMAMLPYVRKWMSHTNGAGMQFNAHTQGLGDIELSGIYKLNDNFQAQLGLGLPTGATDARDANLMSVSAKLPYPMQLGSGTYDPLASLTYKTSINDWSFGTHGKVLLRMGKNSEGYRLGDELGLTGWVSHPVIKGFSSSFRLDGKTWGNIHGFDADLMPGMVPTARNDLRGGQRVDALIGLHLNDYNIGAEFGLPVYQYLEGPQLETDYKFTLSGKLNF